ncbi:MAG: hypothetical protein UR80_C0007G0016 [Parcubacteria group bacterium GW2011_GWB1_35_5]|nr:MAG: hypothetical protein UR80_C0007G0016 [Parcubacteria group bacterium GW2011_GWB1_35_5]
MLPPHTLHCPFAEYRPLSFLVTTGLFITCIVGLLSVLHFIHKAFSSAIKKITKLIIAPSHYSTIPIQNPARSVPRQKFPQISLCLVSNIHVSPEDSNHSRQSVLPPRLPPPPPSRVHFFLSHKRA